MSNEANQPTPENPAPTPAGGTTPPPSGQKSDKKLVSGLLAILLGWLGIHKFYLGYQKEGIIMLVVGLAGFLLCGIPTSVVGVIGIIEGIMYLTKTDEEFEATYVQNQKPWF